MRDIDAIAAEDPVALAVPVSGPDAGTKQLVTPDAAPEEARTMLGKLIEVTRSRAPAPQEVLAG